MKIKSQLLTAVLALGLASHGFAQANVGDLILGFVPTGTQTSGDSTNLEVDLGTVQSFLTAGPGTYTVANLGTDLTSTYGATWDSTNLGFGVVGTVTANGQITGATSKTIWGTSTESGGTYPATGFIGGSNLTAEGHINTIYSNGNSTGIGGSAATNLADLSSQTDAVNGATLYGQTNSNSVGAAFSAEMGTNAFSIPSASNSILLTAVNSGNSEDLLQLANGSGNLSTDLGYFTLSSSGILSFTVIPEPSTYAAILGALTIGFVLIRRRNRSLA
jgi:hypothetical protein